MLGPFAMLASPAVIWATLLFTTCIAWLVGICHIIPDLFGATVQLLGVSCRSDQSFVFRCFAPRFSDRWAIDRRSCQEDVAKKWCHFRYVILWCCWMQLTWAKPEFRLPIMISYLAFTTTGFFAWGQSAVALSPWPVPVIVGLRLINFGIQLGTTGIVSYVVDCHREKTGEAFAVMNFIKNMFAFGLVNYINNWIATQGIRNTFFTIGGLTAFAALTTIPMYIYGKRARSWVHRHNVAGKDHLWKKTRLVLGTYENLPWR